MTKSILTLDAELNMPLTILPVRSTLVKLGDRTLLISPLPSLQHHTDQIKDFAEPTDIIAPNGFHHLDINKAMRLYPQAKLWCAPVLREKRKDVPWNETLSENWEHNEQLMAIHLTGTSQFDEFVFYHRASKTLIVCDLFFNHVHAKGLGSWLIFNAFGTYRRFAVSRLFKFFAKDKNLLKKAVQKIASLDVEQVIMAHGEIINQNAKEQVIKALRERNLIP